MAKHRLKPGFDSGKSMQNQIREVSEFFGDAYDDREPWDREHVTLTATAEEFKITILKARKMLITAGKYSIAQSRQVQELAEKGLKVPEIMEKTSLSRSSVQSYLPYSKVVYNMPERSVGADRIARWRESHKKDRK